MRCKKHYTDLSSAVGVCACCLRERLLSLIQSQQQVQSQIQHFNTNSENNPPPLSQQFNSRRSDAPRHHHSRSDQLFYKTPEVAPTTSARSKKKRSFIRLLSFHNIFRSRNRKPVDSVPDATVRESRGGINATSSSSWFSSIISGGRRRRKQAVCNNESTVTAGRGPVRRDRGMSPVRNDGDEDEYESTESWKNTPRRTPAVRRGGSGGHVRNTSGLAFCLSPLVRASPNLQWNQKGLPPEVVFSGEIGGPVKPYLSTTKSFSANRSRKLADFGRLNSNR